VESVAAVLAEVDGPVFVLAEALNAPSSSVGAQLSAAWQGAEHQAAQVGGLIIKSPSLIFSSLKRSRARHSKI
jgi:hypothetical protein